MWMDGRQSGTGGWCCFHQFLLYMLYTICVVCRMTLTRRLVLLSTIIHAIYHVCVVSRMTLTRRSSITIKRLSLHHQTSFCRSSALDRCTYSVETMRTWVYSHLALCLTACLHWFVCLCLSVCLCVCVCLLVVYCLWFTHTHTPLHWSESVMIAHCCCFLDFLIYSCKREF